MNLRNYHHKYQTTNKNRRKEAHVKNFCQYIKDASGLFQNHRKIFIMTKIQFLQEKGLADGIYYIYEQNNIDIDNIDNDLLQEKELIHNIQIANQNNNIGVYYQIIDSTCHKLKPKSNKITSIKNLNSNTSYTDIELSDLFEEYVSNNAPQDFIKQTIHNALNDPDGLHKQNAKFFGKKTEISQGETYALAELAKLLNNDVYPVNIDAVNPILSAFDHRLTIPNNHLSKKYYAKISDPNITQSKSSYLGGGQKYNLKDIRNIQKTPLPDNKLKIMTQTKEAAAFFAYTIKQCEKWTHKNPEIKTYSISVSHNQCKDDIVTPIFYNDDSKKINNTNEIIDKSDTDKFLNKFNEYLKYFLTYTGPENEFSVKFYAQESKETKQPPKAMQVSFKAYQKFLILLKNQYNIQSYNEYLERTKKI